MGYVETMEKQYLDMVDRATQLIHLIGTLTSKFYDYDVRLVHKCGEIVCVQMYALPENILRKVIEEQSVLDYRLCITNSVLTAVMK